MAAHNRILRLRRFWLITAAVVLVAVAGLCVRWNLDTPPFRESETVWDYSRPSLMNVAALPGGSGPLADGDLLVTGGDGLEIVEETGLVTAGMIPPEDHIWNTAPDTGGEVIYAGGKPGSVSAWTREGRLLWTSPVEGAVYTSVGAVPEGDVVAASVFKLADDAWETRVEWLDAGGESLAVQVLDRRLTSMAPLVAGPGALVYLPSFNQAGLILTVAGPESGVAWEATIPLGAKYASSMKPAVEFTPLEDGLLVVAVQCTGVFAYAAGGTPAWSFNQQPGTLPGGESWYSFCADGRGGGYVVNDRTVIAVDAAGGERWRRETELVLHGPTVSGDALLMNGYMLPDQRLTPVQRLKARLNMQVDQPEYMEYLVELDLDGRLRNYWTVPKGFILSHGTDRADTCYGWHHTGQTPGQVEVVRLRLPR